MEKIPTDRPILFCVNHPNAFMDALVLGMSIKRRTWFLARSDVFRKKLLGTILSFVGIIPIYRLLEGAEHLSKNDETFDRCARLLKENKTIMIFSEGLCVQERRLRKLKKGTARIAFDAEEKNNFKLNLTIVPVGLNYSSTPWKFHKPLYVQFGEPFLVSDYEELYKKDKARAMNLFTRDLEERMKNQLLHIDEEANDKLVEQLEEMFTEEQADEERIDPKNQKETYHISREIVATVNTASKNEPERIVSLREKLIGYFASLKKIKTRDWVVRHYTNKKLVAGELVGDFLFFLLGFPFWIFGLITNYVPYKVPYLIANKIVKLIEWHASVNATTFWAIWQFWWLLQSLVVALVFRNWYLLFAFMIAVPLCGMFAQWYWVEMKKVYGKIKWLRTVKNNSRVAEEMMKRRKEIEKEYFSLKRGINN
jgi:1-acyl-sn-glycerol-3-phosphate acyltransferase